MESRPVDDLINNLTRQVLQLFERFVARARSVTAEDGPFSAAAVEKIRKDQQRLVQETDEVMNTFAPKLLKRNGNSRRSSSLDRSI